MNLVDHEGMLSEKHGRRDTFGQPNKRDSIHLGPMGIREFVKSLKSSIIDSKNSNKHISMNNKPVHSGWNTIKNIAPPPAWPSYPPHGVGYVPPYPIPSQGCHPIGMHSMPNWLPPAPNQPYLQPFPHPWYPHSFMGTSAGSFDSLRGNANPPRVGMRSYHSGS